MRKAVFDPLPESSDPVAVSGGYRDKQIYQTIEIMPRGVQNHITGRIPVLR